MKKKNKTQKEYSDPYYNDDDLIILNHIPVRLKPVDLDKDGKSGGYEDVYEKHNSNMTTSTNPTELGDTMREIDRDVLDPITKMTSIDSKSFITEDDRDNITAFNSLVTMRMITPKCLAITRQFLRVSKSIEGKNLQISRDIAIGQHTREAEKQGFMAKIKNNFMGKNKDQEKGAE